MEWINLFKFVLIKNIKNLFYYLRIKLKDVYLINNTTLILKSYKHKLNYPMLRNLIKKKVLEES